MALQRSGVRRKKWLDHFFKPLWLNMCPDICTVGRFSYKAALLHVIALCVLSGLNKSGEIND